MSMYYIGDLMEPAVEIMTAERDNCGLDKLPVQPSHIHEAIRRLTNRNLYPLTAGSSGSIAVLHATAAAPSIDDLLCAVEDNAVIEGEAMELLSQESFNEFDELVASPEDTEGSEEGDIIGRYMTNTEIPV